MILTNENANLSTEVDVTELNNNPILDLKTERFYGNFYSDFLRDFSSVECKYYAEPEISSIFNSYNFEFFSLFSMNCQSILSKYNSICSFIEGISHNKSKISVVCLQEIWHSFNINFECYDYYSKPRINSRGGGVALLISKEYQAEEIQDDQFFSECIFECIAYKVTVDGEDFIVSSVYHPPGKIGVSKAITDRIFLEKFNDYLNFLNSFDLPIMFGGDLNCNSFELTNINSMAMEVFERMSFEGFLSITTKATRITQQSSTLIDMIGVKDCVNKIIINGVCTSHVADHLVPFIAIKINDNRRNKPPEYFTKRTLTETKLNSFRTALALQDWRQIIEETRDVSVAFGKFIAIFMELFDKHVPKEKIKFNRRTMRMSPHMSRGLLKSRLHKQKLYARFLARLTPESWNLFKNYRNLFNKLVRKAKIIKIKQDVREANGSSKKLWDLLKNNIGKNRKESKIDHLLVNGEKISDKQKMADSFNSHFAKIGPELTKEIPKLSKSYKDFLGPRTNKNFYMFPISEYQLKKFIGRIAPKKSQDVNEVSMYIINFVKTSISQPLSHIINLSFGLGTMPNQTKISKTIIIHKGGATNLLDQFRGVSLINSFSKIHEKVIYTKLLNFLESNEFFQQRQYGFRKKRSTFHAILDLTNRLTQALASGKVAMAILLDVRKCFDMLDRNILLGKLEHFGIRGRAYDLMKSYFEDRKQRVYFKGTFSQTLEDILWGVLQGSILGVILFLIYINDFQNCSQEILSFLFADDNVVELEADNLSDLINKVNIQLPKVLEWYSSNKLLLHPKKTKVMIFGMPRQLRFISEHDLGLLNNFPVYINLNNEGENDDSKKTKLELIPNENEKSVRHLGVLYDNKLTFEFHFKKIFTKISSVIFSLSQMKNILDGKHLKMLYTAYVKSNIEYCCELLAGAPASYIKPIIKLQKRAVRIIAGASRLAHTTQLFKDFGILPFDKLIIYNVCKFMFRYRKGEVPCTFTGTWVTNEQNRNRILRNDTDFYIPFTNRSYLKNLPLYKFPSIWNSLTNELKSEEHEKTFLTKLNSHLLEEVQF